MTKPRTNASKEAALLADDFREQDDERLLYAEEPAEQLPASSEPWEPKVGPAFDPYEDLPAQRRAALQPLLAGPDADAPQLVAASVQLAQGSGADKLAWIVGLPNAAEAVPALAPEELVFLCKDIGIGDCGELMALASPRQLQALVDLDAWQGDQLDIDRFFQWLAVARHESSALVEKFLGAQEDGVLALALAPSIKVVLAEDELDEVESSFEQPEVFVSPDGTMRVVVEADADHLDGIRAMIEALYRMDLRRGRTVLRALHWELPLALQEDLYELRAPRLRDCGFLPKEEALGLYQYLDPHAAARRLHEQYRGTGAVEAPGQPQAYLPDTEPMRLGLALRDQVGAGLFLQRCLLLVPANIRERVHLGLVHLAYQVQSARADAPAEVDALPLWSRHALQTASMGLEHVSGGDEAYGALLLAERPLSELFGIGHGLVLIEFHRARRLRARLGGAAGVRLLEPTDAALVDALTRRFPGLPVVDAAPARDSEGDEAEAASPTRPVADLLELGRARERVKALDAAAQLVEGLCGAGGLAAEARTGDLTLVGLFATALVHWVVSGRPSLEALGHDALQQFLTLGFATEAEAGQPLRPLRPDLRKALTAGLLLQQGLDDAQALAMTGFVDEVLLRLREEFGALQPGSPLSLALLYGVVRVNAA